MFEKIKKFLLNLETYKIDTEGVSGEYYRMHLNEGNVSFLNEKQIKAALKDIKYNEYPDKALNKLYKKATVFYNINKEYILATNGSDELINLVVRSVAKTKNPKILILEPTYSYYKLFAKANNVEVLSLNILDDEFNINVEEIIKTVNEQQISLICIPNPLAIAGNLISQKKLIQIIENVKSLVLIDEAYIEFTEDKGCIGLIEKYQNLIVSRTLSKFYGLAGIRIGFGFGQPIEFIKNLQDVYAVNCLSATITTEVLHNADQISSKRKQNKTDMIQFVANLKELDFVEKVFNTDTNFCLVKLKQSALEFCNYCKKNGFLIRQYSGKMENFVRITLINQKVNNRFIEIVKRFNI